MPDRPVVEERPYGSTIEETRRELPFPVWLTAIFGFAKAGFPALMGVIGLFAWESGRDPWGIGALVLVASSASRRACRFAATASRGSSSPRSPSSAG